MDPGSFFLQAADAVIVVKILLICGHTTMVSQYHVLHWSSSSYHIIHLASAELIKSLQKATISFGGIVRSTTVHMRGSHSQGLGQPLTVDGCENFPLCMPSKRACYPKITIRFWILIRRPALRNSYSDVGCRTSFYKSCQRGQPWSQIILL
jgi:hypothetical protein